MAEIIPLKPPMQSKGCPMCGKAENADFRPFCSRRCADLDLGKWFKEDYRIASNEEADLDGESYDED